MRQDDAVVEVMSTAVSILLVLTVISSILFWGGPYIEELKSKSVEKTIENRLSTAIDTIREISHETAGSRRNFLFEVSEGVIDIDEVGDRFVLFYTFNSSYDFTVEGLNDNDNEFQISKYDSDYDIGHIHVFWFPDDPLFITEPTEMFSFLDGSGRSHTFFQFDITALYTIQDITRISSVKLRLTSSRYNPVFQESARKVQFIKGTESLTVGTLLQSNTLFSHIDSLQYGEYTSYPTYIESSDIKDLFQLSYEKGENHFSLVSCNTLFSDRLPLFLNTKDMQCELIVNYIVPPKAIMQQNEDTEQSEHGKDDSSNTDEDTIQVYRSDDAYMKSSSLPLLKTENQQFNSVLYNYCYQNEQYSAYFQKLSSQEKSNPLMLCVENCTLSYNPGNMLYFFDENDGTFYDTSTEKTSAIAEAGTNVVRYPNQYSTGINLQYTMQTGTVKEELVIKDRSLLPTSPSPDTYLALQHEITTRDLSTGHSLEIIYNKQDVLNSDSSHGTYVLSKDPIYFSNKENTSIFCLPEIYAWDSSDTGNSIQLQRLVLLQENTLFVWILTPWSWLSDSSRVYPVIIDDTTWTYYPGSKYFSAAYSKGSIPPVFPPVFVSPPYTRYGNLSKNIERDEQLYNSWALPPTSMDYYNLWYHFEIHEDLPYIKEMNIRWNGHEAMDWNPVGNESFLYIWKDMGGTYDWEEIVSKPFATSDIDLEYTIQTDFNDYLLEGKYINIMYAGGKGSASGGGGCFEDYIELAVRSNSPPLPPHDPIPDNGAMDVSITPTLRAIVDDPDGDAMDVDVYLDGDPLESFTGIQSGAEINVEIVTPLSGGTTHTWYIEATDTEGSGEKVQSPPWVFSTRDYDEINFDFVEAPDPREILADSTVLFSWECQNQLTLEYHYKLEGYIENWSSWTQETSRTYTDLPCGVYTFVIEATNKQHPGNPDNVTKERTFIIANDFVQTETGEGGYGDIFGLDAPLTGCVRIDLYDLDEFLFGRIYLFDLGNIKHQYASMVGTDVTLIENNGLLSIKSADTSMRESPGIVVDEIQLNFPVTQLRQLQNYYSGGTGRLRFSAFLMNNYVREQHTDVFNVKLQIYGPHEDTWLSYLQDSLDFTIYDGDDTGHTLLTSLGGDQDNIISYNPTGGDLAGPKAGQQGGLYALDESENYEDYIFKDNNGNWEYDYGDELIHLNPDGLGNDAEPDFGDPGGIYALDIDNKEPYIFLDTGDEPWEYDGQDNNGDIAGFYENNHPRYRDPDNDGLWPIYWEDPDQENQIGGIFSLDSNQNSFTFIDFNNDWIYGAYLNLKHTLCKVGFG